MSDTPTPGPWKLDEKPDREGRRIVHHDGYTLAAVYLRGSSKLSPQWGQRDANARLIAAAPDLLRLVGNIASEPCSAVRFLKTDCETWLRTHPSAGRCTRCEARLMFAELWPVEHAVAP